MQSMNIHHCTNLRVSSYYPENGNSLCLAINHGNERDFIEINLFNLPKEITDKLLAAFPPMRFDAPEEQREGEEVPF